MSSEAPRIMHPHISRHDDVCGGSPVIAGTRFPVRSVVFYILRLGFAPGELTERFPHLTLAQVYDALAYYYDNCQDVDADIAANRKALAREGKAILDEIRKALEDYVVPELRKFRSEVRRIVEN